MTGSAPRSSSGIDRQDHRLDDLGAKVLGADVGIVLRRDDDRADPLRDAVLVLDGDLGLAVRAQVRQLAGLADLGEPARHAVRERDRQRHQLGRLVAGEAEHHPLVAGAELDAGAVSSRTSSAASTPWAMSGDCSLMETSVPQVR